MEAQIHDLINQFLNYAESIEALLPTLPREITITLHLIVIAGLVYALDIEIISFKGNRIRVFGKFADTKTAIAALTVTFAILATYNYWIEHVYNIIVLTGWQAFGLLMILMAGLILTKSHRKIDLWTFSMIIAGAFFFILPWIT